MIRIHNDSHPRHRHRAGFPAGRRPPEFYACRRSARHDPGGRQPETATVGDAAGQAPRRPSATATLAPPCGVRAIAVRALDKAGVAWRERFVGGGVTAVVAATLAGLAIAPLARRIAPPGLIDIGPAHKLPKLGSSKVMLHSKVSDPAKLAALRAIAATFRSLAAP